jgi:translation initiation factor 5B
MAPKIDNKKVPSGIAKLKAHLDAKKKAENEQLRMEEEKRKQKEEEFFMEIEQQKIDKIEKNIKKEEFKENSKEKKRDSIRNQQLKTLLQMKKSGMQIKMTKELEEYELKMKHDEDKIQNQCVKNIEHNNIKTNEHKNVKSDENDDNNKFRAPISCFLGHVDSGKTSLQDKIRNSNVQEKEANNITQQINASYLSKSDIITLLNGFDIKMNIDIKIPKIIICDSPGHEAFANLRNRGSSICDIAILVVDISHGLENQTKESLNLLKQKKCPFIVALNKVDRLYGWIPHENMDIQQSLSLQPEYVLIEFENKINNIKLQLAEEGLNTELYYNNKDYKKYISIVPTSAKTGEGIVDLVLLKIKLVQQFMEKQILYKDELQCTIMEINQFKGLGMTIDVILVNGTLYVGDTIVLCGIDGPIVTQIRIILTPPPKKEIQKSGNYKNHNSIKAANCIKIVADKLENVVAGTQLYVAKNNDEIEKYKLETLKEINNTLCNIAEDKIGVTVQASTLGGLEALLSFLNQMKIPVGHVALGPIHKKHTIHTISMKTKIPKYACILAFDVEIAPEVKIIAEKEKIKIFESKVIYHLFDIFTKHSQDYDNIIKEQNKLIAIFPTVLQVLCCFHPRDPLVIGCRILEGQVKIGTPLCVRQKNGVRIGKVIGIQENNKNILTGKKGMEIAIKIDGKTMIEVSSMEKGKIVKSQREQIINYGRQVQENNILTSVISRNSIDALKESFRDEMTQDDWKLIIELKKEQRVV